MRSRIVWIPAGVPSIYYTRGDFRNVSGQFPGRFAAIEERHDTLTGWFARRPLKRSRHRRRPEPNKHSSPVSSGGDTGWR